MIDHRFRPLTAEMRRALSLLARSTEDVQGWVTAEPTLWDREIGMAWVNHRTARGLARRGLVVVELEDYDVEGRALVGITLTPEGRALAGEAAT